MAFTLNLPFSVCYPATRLVRRRLRIRPSPAMDDQAVYFEQQYRDTHQRYRAHMSALDLSGKSVLDVGSGLGGRALGWLDLGAAHVTNVDINRQELEAGRAIVRARYPERASRVVNRHPDDMAGGTAVDVAILFDAFEHLVEPDALLRQVYGWLRPGGVLWVGSIGWYHYLASHCTGWHIPIPWCQVLFSERAIIKTIRTLLRSPGYTATVWERIEGLERWDSVTTLRDRPGEPLNMLSLRQIRRVMRASPFELRQFRVYGFSGKANPLAPLLSPLAKVPVVQELFHSYYTALLVKSPSAHDTVSA